MTKPQTTLENRIFDLSMRQEPFELQIEFHKGQDGEPNLYSCNVSCWYKLAWQYRGYGDTIEKAVNDAITKAENDR